MTEAPKAKIYTRTGDKGQTHLVDGSRVAKSDLRVESYGTVDELNSSIGVVRSELRLPGEKLSSDLRSQLDELDSDLEKTQNILFNLGSLLATEKVEVLLNLPAVEQSHIQFLEKKIDQMTLQTPELKNFILPAGSKVSAHLHMSRTICRRAERRVSELTTHSSHYDLCLMYLNRLSDYLFVASRWCNVKFNVPEVIWKKLT